MSKGILGNIKTSTWLKINCVLSATIAILLAANYFGMEKWREKPELETEKLNPCCALPCENGGVCFQEDNGYYCDCYDTGYYGTNCKEASSEQWLKTWFRYNINNYVSLTNGFNLMYTFVKMVPPLNYVFVRNLIATASGLGKPRFEHPILNDTKASFSARSLPPIPKHCPTPMGLQGLKELPPIVELYKKLLKRLNFTASPNGINLLFASYIQHFVSQFNYNQSIIDMSHVYGKDEITKRALRSFTNGKLKSRVYLGEEYPPFLKDCSGVKMYYPLTYSSVVSRMFLYHIVNPQWALGNPGLSFSPMLFVWSTIWLREHNRVCTILSNEHNDWNDDQLYETAKLIITGEIITLTLSEYLQHYLQIQMKIDYTTELVSQLSLNYIASVPQEFSILPIWHSLMSDKLEMKLKKYNITDMLYSNNDIVFKDGLDTFIDAIAKEPAGKVTRNNIGNAYQHSIEHLIYKSRVLKIQSFNSYRKKFNLKPYANFETLTGDFRTAAILKKLYSDVDSLELVIGILMEHNTNAVAPETLTTVSGAWLIGGLLSHPIVSPDLWNPSTFGGEIGMNIVKSCSLKKLICLNLKSKCRTVHVDFKIPLVKNKNSM